jgi:predicted DNA repair protein MutK
MGSLKNKLLLLLPAALVLSWFLPWAITPLLMLGGLYLCFEGYEKVHHMFTHAPSDPVAAAAQAVLTDAAAEDAKVAGAIRTDLVLSAEIMAIALASITATDFLIQALTLLLVGILITAGVYGAVALIVKADDIGVALARANGRVSGPLGRGLVRGMPPFLSALSLIGMLAMLWVGGGILVHGLAEYGVRGPEHVIEIAAGFVETLLPLASRVLAWVTSAAVAAAVGMLFGAVSWLVVTAVTVSFGAKD